MTKNNNEISSPSKDKDGQSPNSHGQEFALKYYEIMLGALSSRERQVIQMFAYVAPAMAAMAWLVTTGNTLLLLGGSCTLVVILAHGRQHILRMAYNFRSCMLQAGKIEREMGWEKLVLIKWVERTKEPPDDFLPEMFKSQVRILRFVMWAIIIVGAIAILESTGRCVYSWLFKPILWPKSNCYQLEYVLPVLAAIALSFIGWRMDSHYDNTLSNLNKKLYKLYKQEK